jgi:hypothetical protein
MFKFAQNREWANKQRRFMGTNFAPLVQAIMDEDPEKIGKHATAVRLACLNLEAIAQTESENWKAVERKRRKIEAGLGALNSWFKSNDIHYYGPELEKVKLVGMILDAASREYPADSTIVPMPVWNLYKKLCKKGKFPAPSREFREGGAGEGVEL